MTWQETLMGASVLFLATALVAVVIVQAAATWRARMSVAREEAYRELAQAATTAQQETSRQLESLTAELRVVRERTERLERLLSEVEEPWTR